MIITVPAISENAVMVSLDIGQFKTPADSEQKSAIL